LLNRSEVDIVAGTEEFGNEKIGTIDRIRTAWLFDISRRDALSVFSKVKILLSGARKRKMVG
jgi:hypothetical protein